MRYRFARPAILLLAVLACCSAGAVTKSPPNLSGVWKLDRDLTSARYIKDDTLVVRQTKQRIRFKYQNRGLETGTNLFVTDGKEQDGYVTRIERTYYKARWKEGELVIVTQHVLDIFGYQAYKETDRWEIAPDGKTLTEKLSDGHVAVYYWQGPAPVDMADMTHEFHVESVYTEDPHPLKGSSCHIDMDGPLKDKMLGEGSYRMCMVREHQAAALGGCVPLLGTLKFATDDQTSSLIMNVSGQFCANEQQFRGKYEVDPNRLTGKLNEHLSGGSGTVEFSTATSSIVFDGVLLYE